MMNSQEHKALRTLCKNFVEKEINPNVDTWERERTFPAHTLFKKTGDLGLLGITKPTEYGGMGYMLESKINRMARDTRLASIGAGADEVMLSIICKYEGILPKTAGL